LASQQSLKESSGCSLVRARLNQDVDHLAILIDRSPEVVLLAVDSHEEFVQMPGIAQTTLSPFECPSESGPNF